VLAGVAVAVGLVMWLAILGVAHAAPPAAATASTKATVSHATASGHAATILMASGATCFVDGRVCSEIPCTELIQATSSVVRASAATLIAPSIGGPQLETPASGCGTRRSLPEAVIVARPGPIHTGHPYPALLANMARRLAAHPPAHP
jgi:hypothetical protein